MFLKKPFFLNFQLIDKLLEHDYGYQYYKTDFENKKVESTQKQPSCDLQITNKTIKDLGVNKLVININHI